MKCRLADIVDFNPKETLKKGTIAKKVAMDKLHPFCRDIPEYELAEYNGGAKFRNGDTIMARITPCLENGKIAKVGILDDNEVGFGSTEYIVFRAKPEITDENFLYYLVCSSLIREPAIKSMVGSSGRQRVQTDVIQNLIIDIPTINIQRKIGCLLCNIDNKIETNQKINDNLQQQLQAIYEKFFLGATSSCSMGVLSEICCYSKQKILVSTLSVDRYFSTENMLPQKSGATNASNLPSIAQTTACKVGDTLVSNIRPYFKKIVYCYDDCGCSTDVLCFTPNKKELTAYLYATLYADKFFEHMMAGAKGTKMPRGDKSQIMQYPIVIPKSGDLSAFNSIAIPILSKIKYNSGEIQRLSGIRDSLLPQLMSGEIDVSDIQI